MDLLSYLAEHFDLPILDWIAANLTSAFGDSFMSAVTHLGDAGIFWIACAVVCLLFPKYRRAGLAMGFSLLIGLLLCNVTLKPLVARIRPYDYQLEHFGKSIQLLIATPHDFSFPSGHTLASFEAAIALMLHHRRLGIAALVLACIIAFSRLYLYVHYPTDVLASVVLGIGIAFLGTFLSKKVFSLFEARKGHPA